MRFIHKSPTSQDKTIYQEQAETNENLQFECIVKVNDTAQLVEVPGAFELVFITF